MKISPKQYAEVLFEILDQASEKESGRLLENFVKLLVAHNKISQVDKIIYFFEQIWNKNKGVLPVQVITAHSLDEKMRKQIVKHFEKVSRGEVELHAEIDENLKGGLVIRYADKSMDYSLRNSLRQLKTKLT